MTDTSLIFISVGGLSFLLIAYVVIDRLGGWYLWDEARGKKVQLKDDFGHITPPKNYRIIIEDKKHGVYPFLGGNETDDGISLLDSTGKTVAQYPWDKLRLVNVKPMFKGNTQILRFVVDDEGLYDYYERKLQQRTMQVAKEIEENRSMAKPYHDTQAEHAAGRRVVWDKEYKGRKVLVGGPQNKSHTTSMQTMDAGTDSGGE